MIGDLKAQEDTLARRGGDSSDLPFQSVDIVKAMEEGPTQLITLLKKVKAGRNFQLHAYKKRFVKVAFSLNSVFKEFAVIMPALKLKNQMTARGNKAACQVEYFNV